MCYYPHFTCQSWRSEWFIYSEFSVIVALVSSTLAFSVFSITGSLSIIPANVWRLSRDLGLSYRSELIRIAVPLAAPGIILGWIACMVITVGSSSEVALLSGPHQVSFAKMISDLEETRRIPTVFAICTVAAVAIAFATCCVPILRGTSNLSPNSIPNRE